MRRLSGRLRYLVSSLKNLDKVEKTEGASGAAGGPNSRKKSRMQICRSKQRGAINAPPESTYGPIYR